MKTESMKSEQKLSLKTLQKCFVEARTEGFVFILTLQKCLTEATAEGFVFT